MRTDVERLVVGGKYQKRSGDPTVFVLKEVNPVTGRALIMPVGKRSPQWRRSVSVATLRRWQRVS